MLDQHAMNAAFVGHAEYAADAQPDRTGDSPGRYGSVRPPGMGRLPGEAKRGRRFAG
jgi:hypothetical protein